MSTQLASTPANHASLMDLLPDELLIQVFAHLMVVAEEWDRDDPLGLSDLPYQSADMQLMPPTWLRGYPFLAQVCQRWRRLLAAPLTQSLVWRRVCVDLGHELVTSIHAPLRWSNMRPSAAEYTDAFHTTTISGAKIVRFLDSVAPYVRSLSVAHSEEFVGEGGEVLSLAGRHDFGPAHLGFGLALLRERLEDLHLYRCPDLLSPDGGVWSLLAQLPRLRCLRVEGLRAPLREAQAGALGELKKLETLALVGEPSRSGWAVGLQALPASWSALTSLSRLELRHQPQLACLPPWLPALPALRHLDLSGCAELAPRREAGGPGGLAPLSALTRLQVLVLQCLALDCAVSPSNPASPSPAAGGAAAGGAGGAGGGNAGARAANRAPAPPAPPAGRRPLPDLTPLAGSLRSLSLAMNRFVELPPCLVRLTRLEHLDMSYNMRLHITAPLTPLGALPYVRHLDFRVVHIAGGADGNGQGEEDWDEQQDAAAAAADHDGAAAAAGVNGGGGVLLMAADAAGGTGTGTIADDGVWDAAKCETMQHLARLARQLKRRSPPARLLMDV